MTFPAWLNPFHDLTVLRQSFGQFNGMQTATATPLATLQTTSPTYYRFTFAGIIVLLIVGLLLSRGEKTGPIVIFVLVLLILLLVLINYRQVEAALITTQ